MMDRQRTEQSVAQPHRPLPRYDARALTEDSDQAEIVLDGQLYHLRITRAGKLILTK